MRVFCCFTAALIDTFHISLRSLWLSAVPVKSLQVFLKDQSENLPSSVYNPCEALWKCVGRLSFPSFMFL